MSRVFDIAVFFAALALLVFSGGCQKPPAPSAVARVGASFDSIEGHRVRADGAIQRVLPATTGPVRDGLVTAHGELADNAMGADIKNGRAATADAGTEIAKAHADTAKAVEKERWYENNAFVKVALKIQWLLRFIVIGGLICTALAFAFRAWAGASGIGWVRVVSEVLFGVISFGTTLVKGAAAKLGDKQAAVPKVVTLTPTLATK